MPLSEHEQRMLDEIERALYQDDPKFATSVNVGRIRRRRPILAGIAFLVGLVALVVGVIATQSLLAVGVVVSVLGFLAMVAAVGLFVFGQPGARAAAKAGKHTDSPSANPTLSNRMEERFRKRFDEPGQ
ncbi:DUF3040 domain-containing protein [Nakamurella flavida]|uniref:DUF3040 domain-containing protein n=1 Tax=Nakamurella flavida TaxID=363630 RepID=A0A938YT17_9ACTN|nr:DUF3040 domain-containing protein [Nakamurella flavida]MBM9478345.1 DUF3040 domain-containing protein [Nakamurella flavida]MDP9777483.1 hypothetical protein [Nakamurella flavida]